MDISKLDRAEVLAALYNASQPLGMGFMHFKDEDMTREQAQAELDARKPRAYFDYLHGRVMKVDLSGDELGTRLYNRDNGEGAAERALASLIR